MNLIRAALILPMVACLTGVGTTAEDKKENKLPDAIKALLDKAEQFEFYSLDPEADRKQVMGGFRGWRVLGMTVVKDAKTRKNILGSLYKGIADSDGSGAKCFEPRHGIRATVDGKLVDLVICFECSWVYVYSGKDDNRAAIVVTTPKPQEVFDKELTKAGVPLPKQPKK